MITAEIKKKLPYVFLIAILGIGLVISVVAFTVVKKWEGQKLWMEFYQASENRQASLQRQIDSDLQALVSLQAFYLHSEKISRAEFSSFTKILLLQHTSIQAIEWIPRIPYYQREQFEKAARKEGFVDFQITEQRAQGKVMRADRREEYFPVYFVEPYGSNEITPGFDLASNPTIKESLEQSRDTEELVATAPSLVGQKSIGRPGFPSVFWVFAPIYAKDALTDSVQARREHLRGFASGFFRLGDIVRGSLEYLESAGIDFYIYDQSPSKDDRFLYFHQSRTRNRAISPMSDQEMKSFKGIKYSNTLNVAGRAWMVVYIPTPKFIAARQSWQPQYVLSVGLVLTGLMVSYLWFNIRRAEELSKLNKQLLNEIVERKSAEEALQEYRAHLEDLVSERTAELSRVNERLEQDIAERKKITEKLRESEERFRRIFEDGPLGMMISDLHYSTLKVNKAFCEMLGYSEQELLERNIEDITYPEDVEKSVKLSKQVLRGKIPLFSIEKRYVKKTGETLWVNLTATTIRDQEGNVLYAMGMVEDISERKAVEHEKELLISELQDALANIKTLKGLIPICAWCKKIRDDKGYWKKVETYIEEHSDASFTAGICPKCLHKEDPATYEEVFKDEKEPGVSKIEQD
ncbi:MAG TPA: CHASE domain-containing protein [Thermodesulfovibrionales bacterium]|nr:CHASE domain-containing protein [Thermodesulfovibrionales bacterium]